MAETISTTDLFTSAEVEKAANLWRVHTAENFHRTARAEIVIPAMARINEVSKQENDPDFLTYVLMYLVNR